MNHLVRKAVEANYNTVGELALFDINEWRKPANDFAVIEAKSELITEAIPEAEESAVDAVEELVESQETIKTNQPILEENMGEEKIVEEVKAVEQPTIDVEALKKSIIEDLKAERGEEKGSPTVKAPAVIGSLGEVDYTKAYWHYLKTGETSDLRKAI